MRQAIVFAIVVGMVFAQDSSGYEECFSINISVAKKGKKCDTDFHLMTYDGDIEGKSVCQCPLVCVNGICEKSAEGKKCKNKNECPSYLDANFECINQTCKQFFIKGDKCNDKKGKQCEDPFKCEDGICKLDKDKGCRYDFDCGKNEYCEINTTTNTSKCMEALKGGENCTNSITENNTKHCRRTYLCNNGKCTKHHSVKEGEKCEFDLICKIGLRCNISSGRCEKIPDNEKFKAKECDANKPCPDGIPCVCSYVSGKEFCGYNPAYDCQRERKDLIECLAESGCNANIVSGYDGSCAREQCTPELDAVLSCKSVCKLSQIIYGKHLDKSVSRYCTGLPTWARILIAFGVLIGVVAIVFIIYVVARKLSRKDYEEISR